jgi:hypothetical protein
MPGQFHQVRQAEHALRGRVVCASLHLSDSLRNMQAIRIDALRDVAVQGDVETISTRRRRKLEALAQEFAALGGLAHIAAEADVSQASLEQIIKGVLLPPKEDGTRSPRSLGNAAARKIESALGKPPGWFDAPDDTHGIAPDALAIAQAFDALPTDSEQAMAVRQSLYWAVQGMLRGAGGTDANTPGLAPVARPTPARRKHQ